jgi:hypothetical protein
MGMISFLLPENLLADQAKELDCACISGGPDNMPWPSDSQFESPRLTIRRAVEESGYLVVPWQLPGRGSLMGSSSTLMERDAPYDLLIELARGKVNQVRCQLHDWCMGGLQISPEIGKSVREAGLAFGRALLVEALPERNRLAQEALLCAYQTADLIVQTYIDQVFSIRHQRQPRLDTLLGCCLSQPVTQKEQAAALTRACNNLTLDFSWHHIEPAEGQFDWEHADALLQSAIQLGCQFGAGPIIDFAASRLPDWIMAYENDPQRLVHYMTRLIESVIRRYRGKIRRWQLTHGSNLANVLRLSEDDLLWVTVRMIEVARQVDSELELSVGLVQPWGEYMAVKERLHSPFIFADTLSRAGVNLASLSLELVMGVAPRGNYCRDLLETSRLIDLYALLGMPLDVTLGYPAASEQDEQADQSLHVGSGSWQGTFSPETQANWAAAFTALALSKPCVKSVQWAHFSDQVPHLFPHCGLVDAGGQTRPVMQRLQELRETHLR